MNTKLTNEERAELEAHDAETDITLRLNFLEPNGEKSSEDWSFPGSIDEEEVRAIFYELKGHSFRLLNIQALDLQTGKWDFWFGE